MRKQHRYWSVSRKLLLQSTAALLLLLFIGNILETPLSWLESGSQSYELCDHHPAEEEPLDDAESQENEKKSGFEEFIPSLKTSFATLIELAHSPAYVYKRNFKSRASDRISHPPKAA